MRLDHGRWPSLVLAVLMLAGCGSTVAGVSTAGSAGGLTAEGELGMGPSAAGGTTTTGRGRSSPLPGAASGPTAISAGTTGAPAVPSAAVPGAARGSGRAATIPATPRTGASGPGFTAKQIFIGVGYDSTYSQELGQSGVSSGSTTVGDQKEQVTALVDDINRHGGIAGRTVVPVFYDTRGETSQNDPGTLAQAACAAWTEDRQVFAAMTFVVQMDNPTLYNCLARHQVIFLPFGGDSEALLEHYAPYLWAPSALPPERLAPVWIDRLVALGYFHGWNTTLGRAGSQPAKIGLLYGDGYRNGEPQTDSAFVDAVKRALAAHGLHITDSAQISNSQADEAAAVLRFKSDHVTHVLGDYSIVNFTTSAESQQYRPRYGFTSLGGGVALKLFATSDQLGGALGVGWVPSADVEAAQDPGDVSPAEAHCRTLMNQAHQPTSSRLAWFAMTQACDTFDFLAAAIPRSGLSPAAFPAAAAALGQLAPVSTFQISFPRGRPDGAGAVRDVGYLGNCNCFTYLSKTNHPA